jgi:hypothetical protein
MKEKSDEFGNKIIVYGSDVFVKLASESKARSVGTIKDQSLYVVRRREKHLHYRSYSYGFNHFIIKNTKHFNKVILTDEYGTYIIPNELILQKGKFLLFKNQGFELQIFLSLNEIFRANGIEVREEEPEEEKPIVYTQNLERCEQICLNSCMGAIPMYLREGETTESVLANFGGNPIDCIKWLREREFKQYQKV